MLLVAAELCRQSVLLVTMISNLVTDSGRPVPLWFIGSSENEVDCMCMIWRLETRQLYTDLLS
jgi:hypothetical protein